MFSKLVTPSFLLLRKKKYSKDVKGPFAHIGVLGNHLNCLILERVWSQPDFITLWWKIQDRSCWDFEKKKAI